MSGVVLLTQRNCLAACGFEPRQFLTVVRERSIPHQRIGKTVCVRPDDFLSALESATKPQVNATEANPYMTAAGLE